MIYQNFYIKAPVKLLGVPLPLKEFIKKDEQGQPLDPVEYMTIPEYLTTFNHRVSRYSNDGTYFIKGFGFNLSGLDELRAKLADFGLTLGTDIWILSPAEVQIELQKREWKQDDMIADIQ